MRDWFGRGGGGLKSVLAWGLMWLGLCGLIWVGCSPVKTVKKTTHQMVKSTQKLTRIKITGSHLQKRVALTPIRNATPLEIPDIEPVMQRHLLERINRECSHVRLLTYENPDFPSQLVPLPIRPSQQIDNLALARMGRLYGLDAIITANLIDITRESESSGFLWFRGIDWYLRVLSRVQIFDTETGAKLLDETFQHQIEIEPLKETVTLESDLQRNSEINDLILETITLMAEATCETLAQEPWKSYVTAIEGNTIIIATNEDAGLNPGNTLATFDNSEIITGSGEERFFIPGIQTGKIRITAVLPDRVEAELLEDSGIKIGDTVREK